MEDILEICGLTKSGLLLYLGEQGIIASVETGGSASAAHQAVKAISRKPVRFTSLAVSDKRALVWARQVADGNNGPERWRVERVEDIPHSEVRGTNEGPSRRSRIKGAFLRAQDLTEGLDANTFWNGVASYSGETIVVASDWLPNANDVETAEILRRTQTSPYRILLISAGTLRRHGCQVREDGSASAAVEDIGHLLLRDGLKPNTQCFLKEFDEIVVRLRTDAIIRYKIQSQEKYLTLNFAVESRREDWVRFADSMHGFDTTLMAALVSSLHAKPLEDRDSAIQEGLTDGIRRMLWLLTTGYPGAAKDASEWFSSIWGDGWRTSEHIQQLQISRSITESNRWSIFGACVSPDRYEDLAKRIVDHGCDRARFKNGNPKAELEFPLKIFRIGKIESIDRWEVDSLTSILRLMMGFAKQYLETSKFERPLSLGVFGPPGSGKSFGVKQIAVSLAKWGLHVSEEPLEFNVAEFSCLADLSHKLHIVRDVCLTGKVPVVIFDEFDASLNQQPFGWLQHFLLPMQEGRFTDGHKEFQTGDCIFVFAGGINHSFEEFTGRQRDREFCRAKGPDFISRLRGIHNVPSLSQNDHEIPNWKIRRAILLNSIVSRKKRTISPDVVHALLNISGFHHGARSLEAIIDMSIPNRTSLIDISSLPRNDQLDLHVDSIEFRKLLTET